MGNELSSKLDLSPFVGHALPAYDPFKKVCIRVKLDANKPPVQFYFHEGKVKLTKISTTEASNKQWEEADVRQEFCPNSVMKDIDTPLRQSKTDDFAFTRLFPTYPSTDCVIIIEKLHVYIKIMFAKLRTKNPIKDMKFFEYGWSGSPANRGALSEDLAMGYHVLMLKGENFERIELQEPKEKITRRASHLAGPPAKRRKLQHTPV